MNCECDVPETDGEKLGENSGSVFDKTLGGNLMRHKVTAGRETEVQRVLEFEEYEAVSELQERDTLCDGHWKVRSGVLCVACNEKEDSVVLFHGDDFLAEGHDSSLDKVDEVLGAFEIKRLPRFGPTAGREGVFLHKRRRWNESGCSYRPDPKHVDALVESASLEDARPVATPFTRDTGKGQANTLCELSLTEKEIYMTGSGLLQYIALDRTDVVFATKEVRSRTAKADVLARLWFVIVWLR